MKRLMILAALGLCAACGGASSPTASATHSTAPTPSPSLTVTHTPKPKPKPTTMTLRPKLELESIDGTPLWRQTHGTSCKGANGDEEYAKRAGITVYNDSGHKVIGTGFINRAKIVKGKCVLSGPVHGVPIEKFYEIQFVTAIKLAFSRHALAAGAYTSIGDR